MGKTRRMLGWARCPKPDCDGTLWIDADGCIDDGDCEHEDYSSEELDAIYGGINTNDDDGSDYYYDNLGEGR